MTSSSARFTTFARLTTRAALIAQILFAVALFAKVAVERFAYRATLSERAEARATYRTSPSASFAPGDSAVSSRFSARERDRRRIEFDRAAAWKESAERSFKMGTADARTIAFGLSRLGVEDATRDDAMAPSFSYDAERRATRESARSAADALEDFRAEDDDGIDAALAFLRELGADELDEFPEDGDVREETFFYPSPSAQGNPIDSARLVVASDFEYSPQTAAAIDLLDSTRDLFFGLALFGVLPSVVEFARARVEAPLTVLARFLPFAPRFASFFPTTRRLAASLILAELRGERLLI